MITIEGLLPGIMEGIMIIEEKDMIVLIGIMIGIMTGMIMMTIITEDINSFICYLFNKRSIDI